MIDTVTKIYDKIENVFDGYQVTYVNSNRVKSVPLAEDNSDYQAIQEWSAIEGNEIIDNGGGE
tara:strand:+ start:2018 stop:2206 length:189 start_codon:yes stop_codon:yes gene_type:complete